MSSRINLQFNCPHLVQVQFEILYFVRRTVWAERPLLPVDFTSRLALPSRKKSELLRSRHLGLAKFQMYLLHILWCVEHQLDGLPASFCRAPFTCFLRIKSI